MKLSIFGHPKPKPRPAGRKKGFTLIELLVTISILGLLSVIAVSQFNTAKKKGRDVQRKGDLNNFSKALQMYFADYGVFPNDASQINNLLRDGGEFNDRDYVYMKMVPSESYQNLGFPDYCYRVSDDYKKFALFSILENPEDPEYRKYSGGSDYSGCGNDYQFAIFSPNASIADFP